MQKRKIILKKVAAYATLTFLAVFIVGIFWRQELSYLLPTPVPVNYKTVPIGQNITLPVAFANTNKPLFLHFFNPDCPCSVFNIQHFEGLVRQYKDSAQFMVVVHTDNTNYTANKIKDKFGIEVPIVFDKDKKIAQACGVYSTPQAVIIGTDGKLYYRGNYNRARYCTDNRSNFAQMALSTLLKGIAAPQYGLLSTRSYGCSLPYCKR